MTTEEYLRTPETVLPRELALGTLRVADAPTISHQRVVGELFIGLSEHVRERKLGDVLIAPIDVVLDADADLVVQPDLLFVSNERRDRIGDRVFGAPDLVIEVLSPYPRIGYLEEKVGWYAKVRRARVLAGQPCQEGDRGAHVRRRRDHRPRALRPRPARREPDPWRARSDAD